MKITIHLFQKSSVRILKFFSFCLISVASILSACSLTGCSLYNPPPGPALCDRDIRVEQWLCDGSQENQMVFWKSVDEFCRAYPNDCNRPIDCQECPPEVYYPSGALVD